MPSSILPSRNRRNIRTIRGTIQMSTFLKTISQHQRLLRQTLLDGAGSMAESENTRQSSTTISTTSFPLFRVSD